VQTAPVSTAPRPAEKPATALSVAVCSHAALLAHAAAWDDLAAHAADPNPFYERSALVPALAALPDGRSVEVVLVWAPNPLPKQPAILCGLFPIVRRTSWKGMPLRTIATWKHLYNYLGTPLVRADRAAEVLDAFYAWAKDQASLVVWSTISSDTAFRHALTDACNRNRLGSYDDARHTRAMFRPSASAAAYLDRALGGKKHKELRRQQRRLAELGTVKIEELAPGGDVERFIAAFLELEARGWKGQHGSAMRDHPQARELFERYLRGAHERRQLNAWMLGFVGAPLPIAIKINLRAGAGALAYKITYDESLAKYSPGVLLELAHLVWVHEPGAPAWVDSGAAAEHPMINHLWRDRLGIETVVTSTGDRAGSVAVAAFPLARLARSMLRHLKPAKT
jgi:CelD/BcsL family acetyltransferase involved in cellulose biosynthesis